MGLFSFIKTVGEKVFTTKAAATPEAETHQIKADELLQYAKNLGLNYDVLRITLRGDDVLLEGTVARQSDAEKIVLAMGNVEGVDTVDNQMTVSELAPESTFHTVLKGETLSKISKMYYEDATKYNSIFEANKPMLKDVDKIYPGQMLRIPTL
ncbi:peptidoglycan-binding protein LysM [Flavobacterium sp.]